jgi:hypothetical protein
MFSVPYWLFFFVAVETMCYGLIMRYILGFDLSNIHPCRDIALELARRLQSHCPEARPLSDSVFLLPEGCPGAEIVSHLTSGGGSYPYFLVGITDGPLLGMVGVHGTTALKEV